DPSNWRPSVGDRGNPGASDGETWAAWREGYELGDPSITDADGDRLPDRLEYVLGGDPTIPDVSGPVAIQLHTNVLHVTFSRSLTAEEGHPVMAVSDDLQAWTDGNSLVTAIARQQEGHREERTSE